MEDTEKQKISEEVNSIIESRFKSIDKHYLSIRDIYSNYYDWPELDPIRHEISLCIMFGLCQAAITLTNHLLESLLKYSLIIIQGEQASQSPEEIKGRGISSLIDKYAEGIKLYGNVNLNSSINSARKKGLISKDQKKELHTFREIFRNAYSHSDKVKTFGKSTMPVSSFRLDDEKIVQDESGEIEVAGLLIGQGIVQVEISQRYAAPYFQYIDSLVREIREKVFSEKV